MRGVHLVVGDARALPLADESVDCVVTSPPYWQLRDYGVEGQIGMEEVHDCLGWATGDHCGECFICTMLAVFEEVWRVLKPEGTCWVNIGDTYSAAGRGGGGKFASADADRAVSRRAWVQGATGGRKSRKPAPGLKHKDLALVPQRLALALQAFGWWVRSEIVWHKPNAMPEPARDRPARSHEVVWMLAKSRRYYYDGDAVKVPSTDKHGRLGKLRNRRTVWTVAVSRCPSI